MPADPVVSPADTIRGIARDWIGHKPEAEHKERLLRLVDEALDALLAVGERDKAEIEALRKRLVGDNKQWRADWDKLCGLYTEAQAQGERDRRQIARLTEEFEEAARNWRAMARKERDDGWVASMCGEEGIPAHVLSISRALTFEYATQRLRAVLADEEDAGPNVVKDNAPTGGLDSWDF